MHLVRVGAHHRESLEQLWWAVLMGLLALATVGTLLMVGELGSRFFHPTLVHLGVGIGAVLTALRLCPPVTRRLRSVRTGRIGERLVADLLSGLSDDYWLVNDVTLGLAHGTIDHVLIGPCGVVVIETKQFPGHIRCWGSGWSVNGSPRTDIGRRVNSSACAIRYFLSERHPDLASSVLRWVESIVVFTHPLSHVEASDAPATIVRYSQLYQTVLDLSRKHRVASGTADQLAQTLTALRRSREADLAEGDPLTSAS